MEEFLQQIEAYTKVLIPITLVSVWILLSCIMFILGNLMRDITKENANKNSDYNESMNVLDFGMFIAILIIPLVFLGNVMLELGGAVYFSGAMLLGFITQVVTLRVLHFVFRSKADEEISKNISLQRGASNDDDYSFNLFDDKNNE